MNLLKAIAVCRTLKDGPLKVRNCGRQSFYNVLEDFHYLKYAKARDVIAGHHFLNRLLKRFV